MIKRSIIFFVSLILFTNNLLFSQTPPYYHYGSASGLPSSIVHDIIQDANGYIWFATNNGISRFNGTRFKNYGINEGMNSNEIIHLLENQDGEIIIGNYLSGINKIKDGKVTRVTSGDTRVNNISKMFFKNNELHSYSIEGAIFHYKDSLATMIKWINLKEEFRNEPNFLKSIVTDSAGRMFALTSKGIYEGDDFVFRKKKISGLGDVEINCISEDKNKNLIAGGKGFIYVIQNFEVIRKIKTEFPDESVFRILADSYGNIWYSDKVHGVRIIYAETGKVFDISKSLNITGTFVNDIFEDDEKNIWLGTSGKGVYCFHDLFIKIYNEEDGLTNNNVLSFEKDTEERLVIGTSNGINVMEDGRFDLLKTDLPGHNDFIYELKSFNEKIIVCLNHPILDLQTKKFKSIDYLFVKATSVYIDQDTNYLFGRWGNNYYESKNLTEVFSESIFLFGDTSRFNRVNSVLVDSEKNKWFGTFDGLIKITNGQKEFFDENVILNSTIHSVLEDNNNKTIWFAGDKGIARYDLKTSVITNFTFYDSHDLSSSNSFAFDKNNRLWIGNNKGVYILEADSLKHINTYTGLPSNEVNAVFFDSSSSYMWVGTIDGFCSIDATRINDLTSEPLITVIEYVKSGDSIYTNHDRLIFDRDNNNIYIGINAINYSSPASIKYQYKLTENSNWIDSENDFLNFSSMNAGVHNIFVRSKNRNTTWGEPALLKFEIKPGFIETVYFQILSFVFAAGLIMFIAKFRINFLKKKNREQLEITKRIDELKFQALSAMMNPHFVFNSLNSIQYLINIDKKKEANDYVAMMAKLIRKNLDTAQSSFIYLEEEINRLRLYLDIEKLRFGDKFSYEIEVGNNVNVNAVMIPNMIIQPFVENSIWHGIMKAGNEGKISVSFTFENLNIDEKIAKSLLIKVTDNGVGLKKGLKSKSEDDHVSKGIKIIEDRLRLLSKEINLPQPLYIEDLSERNEEFHGTEVTIYLPPELYRV